MDEALYTAAYARELAGQLTAMGFTVVTTRDGDTVRNAQFQDVNRDGLTRENAATEVDAERNALLDELQARIDFCNDEQADLLISLHFDGSSDPNETGFSTWYAEGRQDSADSQRLAQLLNQELGARIWLPPDSPSRIGASCRSQPRRCREIRRSTTRSS